MKDQQNSSPSERQDEALFELRNAPLSQLNKMGGKASTLAKLLQNSFPVPPGISILTSKLDTTQWQQLFDWTIREKIYPVAVRSSAQGEDGSEVSYAGQFKTFLNIRTSEDLVKAIHDCFQSVEQASSKSYAEHFGRDEIPMRVLVQKMILPKYSGVYFTHDPRNQSSGWMIESVEGLGEQLVSGQVTPSRYFESGEQSSRTAGWKAEYSAEIAFWAKKTEELLNYKIDMEWAIDQDEKFWILQVRPITTMNTSLDAKTILSLELQRLQKNYDATTVWDGHSFAELSGVPSEFTASLWQRAFEPGRAFDRSLLDLGYAGIHRPAHLQSSESLLNQVFGRSYLNLKSLEPVYFGKSPYRIVPNPRPHLEFDFKKLSLGMLRHAPAGILQMLKVAWNIQTCRKALAEKALACTKDRYSRLSPHEIYAQSTRREPKEEIQYLQSSVENFTNHQLYGTFLITLLIESTTQGIIALLNKDLGPIRAAEEAQHFLGENLKTIASEMSESLLEAHRSIENWNGFISRFGHRGLGEMELAQPRWIEVPVSQNQRGQVLASRPLGHALYDRSQILKEISALRRPLLLQEVEELENLLQIREEIKMHMMKVYADIRWSLLRLANHWQLGKDIFWLNFDEIVQISKQIQPHVSKEVRESLKYRQELAQIFKSVEMPMSFSAAEVEDIILKKSTNATDHLLGVSLSPGMASGVVHIVENPESEDFNSWPDNIILVAESTDPGWTPLFARSKAIVVSRGGVLSHCAIVAREMGLPAVGEIRAATSILKEGDHVWVDGIHGFVQRTK